MGATNLPHNLDDAVLRRLSKRVYVPLPDADARSAMYNQLLPPSSGISLVQRDRIVALTEGYSGSDIVALCKEAAMGPTRDLLAAHGGGGGTRNSCGDVALTPESVRPICLQDVQEALRRIRPSVSSESLAHFAEWERANGSPAAREILSAAPDKKATVASPAAAAQGPASPSTPQSIGEVLAALGGLSPVAADVAGDVATKAKRAGKSDMDAAKEGSAVAKVVQKAIDQGVTPAAAKVAGNAAYQARSLGKPRKEVVKEALTAAKVAQASLNAGATPEAAAVAGDAAARAVAECLRQRRPTSPRPASPKFSSPGAAASGSAKPFAFSVGPVPTLQQDQETTSPSAPSSSPSAAPSSSPSTSLPSAAPSAAQSSSSSAYTATAATDAFWEKVGSSEEEVRRSAALRWVWKRLDAGDARIVAHLLASPVTGVLTSLDVSSNRLTEEAALGIVRVERQRNKLTSLGLAECSIGPTGAAEIAEYVSGSGVLTELRLDWNEIGDEGAAALASALRVNGVLTDLNLAQNFIGPVGAAALGEALQVNGVLTSLDVGLNRLTEEAALGIVRVERQRNKLTFLGLDGSGIGPTGAAEIADYVSGSGVLHTLNLTWNNIRAAGAAAIAEALRVNGVLKNIDLRHNSLGDEGKGVIRDAVSGREGFGLKM